MLCQWRTFSTSYRVLANGPKPTASPDPKTSQAPEQPPPPPSEPSKFDQLAHAPRSYGKAKEDFTPTPLSRPIGMRDPPAPDENSGKDGRSLKQKRDDFVDYGKHLERRKEL
jgi:ATPase complex subunit ATP10